MRGRGAKIGGDEHGFELIESVRINLLIERDDVFNALAQALASARDCLLHAIEEAGFLFFFLDFLIEAAEESLDHVNSLQLTVDS